MLVGVIKALDGTPCYLIEATPARESQPSIWNRLNINDHFPKEMMNVVFVDKGMNTITQSNNVQFMSMENAQSVPVMGPKGGSKKQIVQATAIQVFKSKFIAHYRVASERLFRNMKDWRLLSETVPNCSFST